jgi:hypothetical protein
MAETRKLAAILAADVVGFSRLTGAGYFGSASAPTATPISDGRLSAFDPWKAAWLARRRSRATRAT